MIIYYVQGRPEISDEEYDRLFDTLKHLEQRFPARSAHHRRATSRCRRLRGLGAQGRKILDGFPGAQLPRRVGATNTEADFRCGNGQ